MKLFWCPQTRAARVLWMLEEAQLEHELVLVDIRDPGSISNPEFHAASPMGKVPALIDGEVKLSESAAICLYLADRYPQTGLAPAIDDPLRGQFLYWMFFTPAVIEPAMSEKFGNLKPNKHSHGWGDYDSMLNTLSLGVKDQPWLLGNQFTAADVLVGSTVYFLKKFGIMPESDVLEAYLERCLARPAYQTALAKDEQISESSS